MAQIIITESGVYFGSLVFTVESRLKNNFVIICPLHEGRDISMEVNPEKDTYHCHSCGARGVFSELVYETLQTKARIKIEKGKSLGSDNKASRE